MKLDENSFLFTDDHDGVVYLVRKKGHIGTIEPTAETTPEPTPASVPEETNRSSNASPANSQSDGSKPCLGTALLLGLGAVTLMSSEILRIGVS
jgi:hypothetical protein